MVIFTPQQKLYLKLKIFLKLFLTMETEIAFGNSLIFDSIELKWIHRKGIDETKFRFTQLININLHSNNLIMPRQRISLLINERRNSIRNDDGREMFEVKLARIEAFSGFKMYKKAMRIRRQSIFCI